MTTVRRWLLPALLLAAAGLLQACGGGDDYWDEYRPRAAGVNDLANQTFVFRDFSYGAVFDSSLSATTTTLAFQGFTASGSQSMLPFSVSAGPASSSGTATLDGATLRLDFGQTDPSLPFSTAKPLLFDVTADVDDGRIQLRNQETGVSQASAPR